MRLTSEQFTALAAKVRSAVAGVGKKRQKYGNTKVTVDGMVFDSKLEAKRYGELKLLERAGKIFRLQCQVPFRLEINSILICRYVADFTYCECGSTEIVVEDTKGYLTAEYRLKRKMMKALLGIAIRETGVKTKSRVK